MAENEKRAKRGAGEKRILTGAALEAAKRQARAELQRILDEEVKLESRRQHPLAQTATATRSY